MEIERFELLITLLEIPLEEDDEKAVDGEDDEDVPIEVSTLIVTEVDDGGLPTCYQPVGDWIVYDKALNGTTKWFISDEFNKSKVERSEIRGGNMKMGEVGEGHVQGSEVGESEMKESKLEGIEVD